MRRFCKNIPKKSVSKPLEPELSTKYLLKNRLTLLCLLIAPLLLKSQATDTIPLTADTLLIRPEEKQPGGKLDASVIYNAEDSVVFDLPGKLLYLYGNARIQYKEITLKAGYILIDFKTDQVSAEGIRDSTGQMVQTPEFSEGEHLFHAKKMVYNFTTKKGIIHQVVTREGEGYIHGNLIKRVSDSVINIRTGKYTTCNLEHPHFEFRFSKSKILTNNKIVTGPAYLSVSDVPTPLAIPFGLFPNKKGQRSGILLPTYGESAQRGFYFENFGYYLGINEYLDLELRSDIYTLGSWAIKAASRYALRYRYNGYFNVNYAYNKLGIPGSTDYQNYRDFSIRWTHNQSEKARPNSRFSANVNVVSSKFNQFNPVNTNAYLSNTFQSGITYQTNWDGKYFLTAGLSHSQNTIEKSVSVTLPDISFSVNRFFPFSRKDRTGRAKWYENISVNYQSNAQNTINTYDSLLFKPETVSRFKNGMLHTVTLASPLKILSYLVMNNSVAYKERWYSAKTEKNYYRRLGNPLGDTLITDTISGFFTARDMSFSSSVSTILYGLVQFKKGPLKGIRHVMTPSVSFSYTPGFGKASLGMYDYYVDGNATLVRHPVFEGALYGYPPAESSGRLGFSLSNNLEIKVRSPKDTVSGTRKIALIENLSFSTAYDLTRDSLQWSPLSVSGRTRLFRDLNISYSSAWDPYVLDSTGTRNLNRFELRENHRLFRLKNTSWNLSLNWNLRSKTKSGNPTGAAEPGAAAEVASSPEDLVDFNIPWSLQLSYSLNYLTSIQYPYLVREKTKSVVQTFNFSGDLNITPKWKVGLRSGYDFQLKKLSYTAVDFYRDLHCWEMRFSWIPTGFRKSWNFTINVKSSVLQDLKLNKKKDFRDY
ncbi:MAG TPA: putative LPS assembly protein LptD [Bacteroidales bacterium]|nr:putative LPS assembly protein LptD [Bacteroidales bacterium]HSA44770.1 putative LPS assembly protein LptD [Bacteroidales bacterium]